MDEWKIADAMLSGCRLLSLQEHHRKYTVDGVKHWPSMISTYTGSSECLQDLSPVLTLRCRIGFGDMGWAYRATLGAYTVAVKVDIKTKTPNSVRASRLWNEWQWLQRLRGCDCVVNAVGIRADEEGTKLILEYHGGTLLDYLNGRTTKGKR